MAGNTKNPFQQEYIDSFQGKDASSTDGLPPETLQQLRSAGYAIDRVGDSDPNSPVYNPNYNKFYRQGYGQRTQTSNPAPQDTSLFNVEPDPIRVTQNQSTTVPGIDDGDRRGRQDYQGASTGAYGEGIWNNKKLDRGSSGKTVSSDAPEQVIYGMEDEYDDDLDAQHNGQVTRSDGETGPPIGLNESARTKTKISNVKDPTALNTGPFMEDITKLQINPRLNELNNIASYTYNIALYMMNSRSYIDITNQPRTPQEALSPPNAFLLMRSGGVGLDNQGSEWFDEFFIDDLEVTNIAVGPNKFKQNTNATDVRFTITEPRGVTLLERLQRLAGSVLASTRERYIHAPYLLEISFKGYDENGTPVVAPSLPKYIPIRITDMQFDVTTAGTQYRVTAIPFANTIMGSIMSTIPFNVEVKAKTVGDIFSAGIIKERVIEERELIIDEGDDSEVEHIKKTTVKEKSKNLAEILTGVQKDRTKPRTVLREADFAVSETVVPPAAEGYDTYEFLIAAEIANAKLNMDSLYDALNTPSPTEGEKKTKDAGDKSQFEAYVQGLATGVTLDKGTSTFKINAGTDITKLINLVIMHSDYMDQNVVDNPDQYASSGDPIKWFKIRPVFMSSEGPGKGYDQKDGRMKYNIAYAVEKNNIYYSDFPWAKKSKPVGEGVHKIYNYMFEGNNTEVLDFNMKFRAAFMQVMTAGTGSPFANKSSNSHFAPVVKEVPQSVEGNTVNGPNTLTRNRAKDLFSSVMSDGVDMVELDMQILGDPAFIPTSDAYWQDKVRRGQSYTEAFMPDGTINYNISPPYVQVNLRTPTDYDENTGLAFPFKHGNSAFSGIYRLTSIDNTFSGGVFQQRLNGIREPLQPQAGGGVQRQANQTNTERNTYQDQILRDQRAGPRTFGNASVASNTDDAYNIGSAGEFSTGANVNDYEYEAFGKPAKPQYDDAILRSSRIQRTLPEVDPPGVIVEIFRDGELDGE